MAQRSHAKRKADIRKDEDAQQNTPAETVRTGIQESDRKKAMLPNIYTDIIESLYEKSRKRVATYYCPNMSCRQTFWDAEDGYVCPGCGKLGIISEFRYRSITKDTRERNIVGYVDSLGRLICSECILKYGIQNDMGLIVYDDTDPFCFEHCELCKEPLGGSEN